ncbi:Vesicle-associated membrane protein-associated protein [Neolecta irregularis DAH-3]|uniref:Vesicle-associated membrane protein-associated protein n=1 Tax=Neolecta irregularis (strain DAH-3) TaxID=1198029 RepID=A0A1U7LIT7_NEOID|nr:Vesicle-associated membrane protein-associated protein [Neolecta irregularis DAH-3]|eukprot:OLL22559.1 Vesicle-associated membrane protein-associated protein [Neolecta irregularis DAH-3]
MSVELNPSSQLEFHRPFTQIVKETLTIKNPHSSPVAFKVKTTAPKQYCVRPNSGRIEAGQDIQVQGTSYLFRIFSYLTLAVILQAMREEPPADFKCRDKFLIQSAIITADQESANLSDFWTHIEKTAKESIAERKIRCHYLSSDEGSNPTNSTTVESGDGDESRTTNAPSSPPPYTPARNSTISRSQRTLESPTTQDTTEPADVQPDPRADDSLQTALDQANAEISHLRTLLIDARKKLKAAEKKAEDRKNRLSTGLVSQKIHAAPEGVPVQLAAALCLLAFFLSYFFF